jgi:ankyrin repeat protein
VQKLLEAGANAKSTRWNGETALMICAGNGNVDAVQRLLAHGADTTATDQSKGQNALMWAAAEGRAAVVKVLTAHGADVNAASKGNFTPILFAAEKGDADTIKVLVAAGADVNKALPDGNNPILIASNLKQPAAVTALLEMGATPTVADRAGNTPLHSAAQAGDAELVKELIAKGADPNAKTATAAAAGRGRGAAGGGGGFGRGGPSGEQTPLMVAAKAGHVDAMKALVAGGADTKLKAQDGTTLLMSAAGSGHVEVVKYAYELDPDPAVVQATNQTGNNAVHMSVTGTGSLVPQKSVCEVIQFLSDKGVDVDMKNAQGRTAIQIANGLPIDTAVDLMVAILKKEGRTPLASAAR